MKPHKHAALIKAWADGAVIQYYSELRSSWMDVEADNPSWANHLKYRIKPEEYDLEKYGAKAGDIWIVNKERLLFTFVDESTGIDCYSFSDGTDGAFLWDWEAFKKGKLLFRANEVNKL